MDKKSKIMIYNEIINNINASKKASNMNLIIEYIDNIFLILYNYINTDKYNIYIKSKTELYNEAINFMLEHFPKLTYKEPKSIGTVNRKIYNNMLKELTDIYIYNPQAARIQQGMFDDAKKEIEKEKKYKKQKI
tara:strand:- start:180 stop:581 length:402 start_codon:yes stop_codon:yes gene_type:complete